MDENDDSGLVFHVDNIPRALQHEIDRLTHDDQSDDDTEATSEAIDNDDASTESQRQRTSPPKPSEPAVGEIFDVTWGHQKIDPIQPLSTTHVQNNLWHTTTNQFAHSRSFECYICMYPHARRNCPLMKCHQCGAFGHSQNVCPIRRIRAFPSSLSKNSPYYPRREYGVASREQHYADRDIHNYNSFRVCPPATSRTGVQWEKVRLPPPPPSTDALYERY